MGTMDLKKGIAMFVVGIVIVGVVASLVSVQPSLVTATTGTEPYVNAAAESCAKPIQGDYRKLVPPSACRLVPSHVNVVACKVCRGVSCDARIRIAPFSSDVEVVCDRFVRGGPAVYLMFACAKSGPRIIEDSKLRFCWGGAIASARIKGGHMEVLTRCT